MCDALLTLRDAKHNPWQHHNVEGWVLVSGQIGQLGGPKGDHRPQAGSDGQDHIASNTITEVATKELRHGIAPEKRWQYRALHLKRIIQIHSVLGKNSMEEDTTQRTSAHKYIMHSWSYSVIVYDKRYHSVYSLTVFILHGPRWLTEWWK